MGEAHRASHRRRLAGDVRVPRRRFVEGRAAEPEAETCGRRPRVTIHRMVYVGMGPERNQRKGGTKSKERRKEIQGKGNEIQVSIFPGIWAFQGVIRDFGNSQL